MSSCRKNRKSTIALANSAVNAVRRWRKRSISSIPPRDTSGSVTIYFIIVTAGFVLLTALLIDFARVAAFRKQAELAVKSGARSVLSSYDPLIYARYGLFIRGGDQANTIFKETLAGNVVSRQEGSFAFLDSRWEETEVTESRPLADHDIFRRQLLEEMKYKAPINLALEVAERFRGVSGAMREAAATVDLLERMRKAYDRREEALDRTLSLQRDFGVAVRKLLAAEVPNPPVSLGGDETVGRVQSIADAVAQYEDYVRKRGEAAGREAQQTQENSGGGVEGVLHAAAIAAYESGVSTLTAQLNDDLIKVRNLSDISQAAINKALLAAREANDEMEAIVAQAPISPSSSPAAASADSDHSSVSDEQMDSIRQLSETAKDLVLEPRFFQEYGAEISLQYNQSLRLANDAGTLAAFLSSLPGSSGKVDSLRQGAAQLQSSYAEYISAYGSAGSVWNARQASFQAHRSHDEERQQEEQKAKVAWSGAAHFLGSLTGISGSAEEREAFAELDSLYKGNLEWNKAETEHASSIERQNVDAFNGRDQAMSSTNRMMDMLAGSLSGVKDQLYLSEYAASRMSHFDPAQVRLLLHGGDTPLDISLQETEYILYGLNNPSGNIAAAYGEIFAFRLAIRSMEGLIECRTMGHPLLVLAAALVYGITKALADLTLLVEKGTIQLSKYAKIDTRYTDYLRLFLLAHGGTANHLARSIAVMEHTSEISFQGAYTYVSGEGKASVRLWFFPGLLKVMGRYGNLGGTVNGNRYEATYIAESSYQ